MEKVDVMKAKWLGCLMLFVSVLFAPFLDRAHAEPLPTTLRLECSDLFPQANNKVVDAYAQIGIAAECVAMPWIRSGQQVAVGGLSGAAIRSKEFGQQFPNLLRVEPPVTTFTLLLYKRKGTRIDSTNWRRHSIASLRGGILTDQLLAGLDVRHLGSVEAALKQLSAGRVDLLLGDDKAIPEVIERLDMANIEAITPPLSTILMYHYLHPSHQQLVLPISQQFMKMGNE